MPSVPKAQLNDDGTVSDPVTKQNQKGYSNYEEEQKTKQQKRNAEDESIVETARKVKEKIKGALPFKTGGSIRGHGCEVRGKTKGKMVTMCMGGSAKGKK